MALINLQWGAIIERAEIEIAEAVRNIIDPNTDDKDRVVTIKITLEPSDDRKTVGIAVTCSSKNRPFKPVQIFASIGEQNGEIVLMEHDTQLNLFKEAMGKVEEIDNV